MQIVDPIKILCDVADSFPEGVEDYHKVWKGDLSLYVLSNKGLIEPSRLTMTGSVRYKITDKGWDLIKSKQKKYDN